MTVGLGRLQVAAAALLFSTAGAAIKATEFSGWQVAGLRSAIAAVALWCLIPRWRRFWRPRCLLVGVVYGTTMVLFVASNKLTTAANSIFLQSTAPLWVMGLAPVLLGERTRRADFGYAALLAIGLALFFTGAEPPLATAPDPVLGNRLAALNGLSWALTLMGLRWLTASAHAGEGDAGEDLAGASVVAGNLFAAAVCVPFGLPLAGGAGDWLIVGYLGLFQIGLAYVAMTRGVRVLSALEVSLLLLLEPVLNSLLTWAVHGERPGDFALAGCLLIAATTAVRTLRAGTAAR